MKIEADDMTFETLADTGKNWKRFDAVLHAAVVKSVSGELARDIALQGEIAAKAGRLLRGRQSAFMVRKYFKTAEEAGAMFDLCDLLKVKSVGQGNKPIQLSTFLQNWEAVLTGMKRPPDDETLEAIFREQIKIYDTKVRS
jgi:hypothetical protein